jgi:hypothetical protein
MEQSLPNVPVTTGEILSTLMEGQRAGPPQTGAPLRVNAPTGALRCPTKKWKAPHFNRWKCALGMADSCLPLANTGLVFYRVRTCLDLEH